MWQALGCGQSLCRRFSFFKFQVTIPSREIECLLNDNHEKGKMMIIITKTSGSQVDSPVAEGKRKEGGGRKIRDLHKDT